MKDFFIEKFNKAYSLWLEDELSINNKADLSEEDILDGLFFIPSNLNNYEFRFQDNISFLIYIQIKIKQGLQLKTTWLEEDFTNIESFICVVKECWLKYLIEEYNKDKYQNITTELIDKILDSLILGE